MAERVVVLNERGEAIGSELKSAVHRRDTPLHLAFSCHVFNVNGELLVTRRALAKATWPGVWTNAFCGHPAPGEAMEAAIRRRGMHELGLNLGPIESVLPEFRYRETDASGIVENELCPVFRSSTLETPLLEPSEAVEYRWVRPEGLAVALESAPWAFSPWLVKQSTLLDFLAPRGSEGAAVEHAQSRS